MKSMHVYWQDRAKDAYIYQRHNLHKWFFRNGTVHLPSRIRIVLRDCVDFLSISFIIGGLFAMTLDVEY